MTNRQLTRDTLPEQICSRGYRVKDLAAEISSFDEMEAFIKFARTHPVHTCQGDQGHCTKEHGSVISRQITNLFLND